MSELLEVFIPVFQRAQKLGILGKNIEYTSLLDHSLAFANLRQPFLKDSATTCLDVGSGAGIPGLILAYQDKNLNPTISWSLCERAQKRADFLKWAAKVLELDIEIIEISAGKITEEYDFLTARLFAAPAVTFEVFGHLLSIGGVGIISRSSFRDTWNEKLMRDLNFDVNLLEEPYRFITFMKKGKFVSEKRLLRTMQKKPLW